MNKFWLWMLIAGVSLFAALAILGVGAFLALPLLMDRLDMRPHGVVLIYEIDPAAGNVDIEKLILAADRRINAGPRRMARVRALADGHIEVATYSADAATTETVRRLLRCPGTLEFRILADDQNDKKLIARAQAAPKDQRLFDGNGKLEAWWVPIKAGEERTFVGRGYAGIARRIRKQAGRDVTEILVLNDLYNITGAYLMRARPSVDPRGRPCLNLTWNKVGGQLFGCLTSHHLPDETTGHCYKLGIVLDGELYSAPSIQSVITDSAEITGSFTQQEVDELSRVLNAESMPARLRLLEKRPTPQGNQSGR